MNKRLGKAIDIMRLAEVAAAQANGISLVQITETFGVNLRTAQRMSKALEAAFPMVEIKIDKDRRKWWKLNDQKLLHGQGTRHMENRRHPRLPGHLLPPPAADRGRPARL